MGKKPPKDLEDKRELEPWEREAEELGATGDEPDPWDNEPPKVVGPAKPASTGINSPGPVPPVGTSIAPRVNEIEKSNSSKSKSEDLKSITKVPGPKRKFQQNT